MLSPSPTGSVRSCIPGDSPLLVTTAKEHDPIKPRGPRWRLRIGLTSLLALIAFSVVGERAEAQRPFLDGAVRGIRPLAKSLIKSKPKPPPGVVIKLGPQSRIVPPAPVVYGRGPDFSSPEVEDIATKAIGTTICSTLMTAFNRGELPLPSEVTSTLIGNIVAAGLSGSDPVLSSVAGTIVSSLSQEAFDFGDDSQRRGLEAECKG